jgi:hypothetical protein
VVFEQQILDILPSDMPGMDFVTRDTFFGNQVTAWLLPRLSCRLTQIQVFFTLRSKDLIIRSRSGLLTHELIPHRILIGDLPAFFVQDHAHWMNLATGIIELRDRDTPWAHDVSNWCIQFHPRAVSTMKKLEMQVLIDIRSPTATMVAARLRPLETLQYTTIFRDMFHSQLCVQLPRFRLSFFINTDLELESVSFRRMVVDSNQSVGALIGLSSQLVLRDKDITNITRNRCVLIPQGKLTLAQNKLHHITVEIHQDSRKAAFHKYDVDQQLGRLVGDGTLNNRLYRIYLHALTSHSLPDPLTGRTGTEEALLELHSAGCFSFQKLEFHDLVLFREIASLTPNRRYYPEHLQAMQTVEWANMSSLSQHVDFFMQVMAILTHARRILVFDDHPAAAAVLYDQHTPSRNKALLLRAQSRHSPFHPSQWTMSGEQVAYQPHHTRDQIISSDDEPFRAVQYTMNWSATLPTTPRLLETLESWKLLSDLSPTASLSYSKEWFEPDLPSLWISTYNMCRQGQRPTLQYTLAFTFASIAYGQKFSWLIPTILSFATNPRFSHINPPQWKSYNLADGYKPSEHRLASSIRQHAVRFQDSFAINVVAHHNESPNALYERRRAVYSNSVEEQVSTLVDDLMRQWPCEKPKQMYAQYVLLHTQEKYQVNVDHLL